MIPVFEPEIGKEEIEAVTDALKKGEISGSFGDYIPLFEKQFAEYCGTKYAVAVSNGTTALHLAVAVAGIGAGDEVLVSSSTNIATALAVHHNNAITVPVDSENDTWNLDLDLIEKLITKRTKAIIPVHLFGHPVDMDRLMAIAQKHNLIVIEDCAESHGATCRGKMTGSFGHMACFSFYANKIITTGEGGMVTTNDPIIADKLRLLRNLAFSKPRFLHEEAGFNYRMTGYQAAMGVAQLKKINYFIDRKREIASSYTQHLNKIEGIKTPTEKDWAKNVYWMYAIEILPQFGKTRDELMKQLLQKGVDSRTFFCPMNMQPSLKKSGRLNETNCPVAERIWNNGLYLPSSTTLTSEQIEFICETIKAISKNNVFA